ncbi:MAG: DNA double-strand break repair nuclease NurA [Bacillota bacterium]
MLEISDELKTSLVNVNQELKEKYSTEQIRDKKSLRARIETELKEFVQLNQMSQSRLNQWIADQVIVGVDGSLNKVGGNYPHYLFLLQALAKNTSKEDITATDLFCPLVSCSQAEIEELIDHHQQNQQQINEQYAANKIKTSKLAALELEVARKAIKKWQPKLIMLDGSLIRYRIEAEDDWEELRQLAIAEEVLLVGVIEEIGTDEVGKLIADELAGFYDRELLFGILEYGEMLPLSFKRDLMTSFLRTSRDPQVIGLDTLPEQKDSLQEVAEVIFTLTPEDGRGIPLWLDIVDGEVRITDKMMQGLMDTYIDSDLQRQLFATKRDERIY